MQIIKEKMKKFIVPAVLLLSAFAIGFYQPKLGMAGNTVEICHLTHGGAEEMTISVNIKAVPAHEGHGDDVTGACSVS